MRATHKEISPSFLPTLPPISFTGVVLLALDRLHCPGWVWGLGFAVIALAWVQAVVSFFVADWVAPGEIRDPLPPGPGRISPSEVGRRNRTGPQ